MLYIIYNNIMFLMSTVTLINSNNEQIILILIINFVKYVYNMNV